MLSLIVLASVAFKLALAVPQIAFPFNSQVPPVARVGSPFNFTFSDTTFKPNGATFQYSITSGPAWLQFDPSIRTLWGTPGVADAVSTEFDITASDTSGSASMKCTLIVTTSPAPGSKQDISVALDQAGNMTGPNSLLAHPQRKFTIDFSTESYASNNKRLYFYSTLADHTPLPAWLVFNDQTLHFAGDPPKQPSSPQTFEILLIASDVAGFAGVWDTFTIIVSDETWAFSPVEQTINLAVGDAVKLTDLRSTLYLGDGPAREEDIQQATAQVPAWLSFDSPSLALSGTPPPEMRAQDVNITAYDNYGDSATLMLHLRFGSLLKSSIGPIKTYPGKDVNYTLDRSVFAEPNVTVDIDAGSANSWLHFDATNLRLSGSVPTKAIPETITLNMTLTNANQSSTEESDIKLLIQSPPTPEPRQSSASSASVQATASVPTSSAGASSAEGDIDHVTSQTKGAIAAVVICPIVGVIAIIFFVLYCCRPRSRDSKEPKSPAKSEISRPIANSVDDDADSDLEKGELFEPVAAEHPPRLDFQLSSAKDPQTPALSILQTPKRFTQRFSNVLHRTPGSPSIILEDGEADALDGFNRSSWGYGPNRAPSTKPHDSMKVPIAMARVSKHRSLRRSELRSSTLSQQKGRGLQRLPGRGHGRNSTNCSSMGDSDCVMGVGHGRISTHSSCPYCPGAHRESGLPLQTHEEVAESSYGTDAPSMISSAQSGWPIPTAWQSTSASKMPKVSKMAHTIRSARAEKGGPASEYSDKTGDLMDRRSLFEKRQSYIRNRPSNRSPFFSSNNDGSKSRKTSSAESNTTPGLGIVLSQPSLRTNPSKRRLVREFSASSSLEPDAARGRRRSKSKWKLPEGFPRALTPQPLKPRNSSKARSSITSALRYEDASPAEWEQRSVSVYSDDDATGGDTVAGADRSSKPMITSVHPALADMPAHERPTTGPPLGPLPTPPVPTKSPRRSVVRPKSAVVDYSSDEVPTIEQPEIAIAVRKARLSQLAQGNKRRIDGLGSRRKAYPDLKNASIMDRPRSDYRPALAAKRNSINRRLSGQASNKAHADDSTAMSKEKSWEDVSGNEAFI